jgi:dihydroorotase
MKMNLENNEQPIAMKIVSIKDEAKDIKTFRFNQKSENKIEGKPGQYVFLWLPGVNLKPFSIANVSEEYFEIMVCKVGNFSSALFEKKVGDYVGVQGPYGTSFVLGGKNAILVGGGYGSAPLAFLGEELLKAGCGKVRLIIGARNKDLLVYTNKFIEEGSQIELIQTTDDGSNGKKGFTTDALREVLQADNEVDRIYTVGPEIMMNKVIELSDQFNIGCQVSVERYMKCGFGICGQCCVDGTGGTTCRDGPIYDKQYVKAHISEFNKYHRDATGTKHKYPWVKVKRIDPHVHFRDGEQKHIETIKHGLELAKAQGVEYVFDMPNTAPPVLREEDVLRRLSFVPSGQEHRYFTYMGASKDPEQLKEAVMLVKEHPKVIGIKMYAGKSTGDLAILKEEDQRAVYQILAQEGYTGVLAVHCEKESFMSDTFDSKKPISHCESRPNSAEVESLTDQIKFAKEAGFKGVLHITHISTSRAVDLVDGERKVEGGLNIVCGVTPHHLLWDDEMMNLPNGLLYKMNPPLRNKKDVMQLREQLKQGKIDWIETDHAPHQIGEKLHGCCPSGYPSLYLYKSFVEISLPELGLSSEEIENLTYGNIVKAFGLEWL